MGVLRTEKHVSVISEYHDQTLSLLVKKGISIERRQKYALQLCTAIADLHQSGVILGDLSPESILVDKLDNCLLVDIGALFRNPTFVSGFATLRLLSTLVESD